MKKLSTPKNEILTERIKLRRWKEQDLAPFSKLNSNPKVMEYFPKMLNREESDAMVRRIEGFFEDYGFGFWVMENRETGEFMGFTGLYIPQFNAHFTPCVEIGWRLDESFWGKQYAVEAAKAVLAFAFQELELQEVVAFTSRENKKSRRVMEKLGMTYRPEDDFDHPMIPAGHPIRPHVLYRVKNQSE